MKENTEQKQITEEAIRKAQTELLLSSFPSILIGVGQDGLVAHWNAEAETTFRIPANQAINHPFDECPVQWDITVLMAGMDACRRKGSAVRVDDVRYQRYDGQEGFLGFTIIPVRQVNEGPTECLLFGADITERKRTEQLKNEFVSTVSHELRSPLTIIKEGVSQVLEGLLGKVNKEPKRFLTISLEGIERLGRIVDDLLDVSKIEAGRFELKRETVDIVGIAKEVVTAFTPQVKEKGITFKTRFPARRIETYVDSDRMIQVFTNLIDNALKFTEKGEIGLSIEEKDDLVECGIWDTGKGIAEPDLPKVFGKFQQFGRTAGPGKKGTGLGLAICKGIVESHQGRITVQSQFGEGTQFTFSIPKYSAKEFFKDCVGKAIRDALKDEAVLSIVIFDIKNFESLLKKMGAEKTTLLVRDLEGVISQNLRRKADVAIKDTRAILVLLPLTGKEEALMVAGRIHQTFDDFLSRRGLQKQLKFTCKVATYPEDGKSEGDLLAKVWRT